jgi:hypothetical protein
MSQSQSNLRSKSPSHSASANHQQQQPPHFGSISTAGLTTNLNPPKSRNCAEIAYPLRPSTKLNRNNHVAWEIRMRKNLAGEELATYLDGTFPLNSLWTADKQAVWVRTDAFVTNILLNNMEDELVTLCSKCSTTAETWSTLCQQFGPVQLDSLTSSFNSSILSTRLATTSPPTLIHSVASVAKQTLSTDLWPTSSLPFSSDSPCLAPGTLPLRHSLRPSSLPKSSDTLLNLTHTRPPKLSSWALILPTARLIRRNQAQTWATGLCATTADIKGTPKRSAFSPEEVGRVKHHGRRIRRAGRTSRTGRMGRR